MTLLCILPDVSLGTLYSENTHVLCAGVYLHTWYHMPVYSLPCLSHSMLNSTLRIDLFRLNQSQRIPGCREIDQPTVSLSPSSVVLTCGPRTSSISTIWELLRNANSWKPQTYSVRNAAGLSNRCLRSPPGHSDIRCHLTPLS